MDLLLVYPEHKYVSEEIARGHLADAIANQEIDDPLIKMEDAYTVPTSVVIQLLMDTGKYTFAQSKHWQELTAQ